MLIQDRGWIIQLIFNMGQITAGTAHQIGVALRANGKNDGFGVDGVSVRQFQLKFAGATCNGCDFGTIADKNILAGGLIIPSLEDLLALSGIKIHVRAEHQLAGRRHDMLALLIPENSVRQMVCLFQKYMGHAELRCTCSRTQSRRSRTDNCHLIGACHVNAPRKAARPRCVT